MTTPAYKFTEFVDLLLVRLYELEREQGNQFFNLDNIAADIKGDIPADWSFDAAKVLESRALADCMFNSKGIFAKISGEGRLYVEEGRGITKRAQDTPASYFIHLSGNNNQLVAGNTTGNISQTVGVLEDSSSALRLVSEIKRLLASDSTISGERRMEALTYTNLMEQELKKPEPNRNLVSVVLDSLSKIASIAGNVGSLVKLFNAERV